jgi:hypothetical protein
MKRLLVGLLLGAGIGAGAWAEPPGSPDYNPSWMPPTRLPGSPAAKTANETARVPGDVRPGVAVPQLSISRQPTDGKKAYNPMRARPTTGGIDDSAAQCIAKRTAEEREACERALSGGDATGR